MPVSAQDYRNAVQAVESGSAPDDVLDGLMDIIDEYEKQKPAAAPRSPIGETGSMLGDMAYGDELSGGVSLAGPKGGDLLDQRIATPEMHAEAGRKQDEVKRMAKEYPNLAIAMKVETNDAKAQIDREKRVQARRAELARPAEHLPSARVPLPSPATDPLEAFGSAVGKARENLPAFAGGKVEHYLEPPVSQFRREMAPRLGDRVLTMGIESDEYKQYADELWSKIYDQAKAEGRPVVRTAYKEAKGLGDEIEKGAANTIGALVGAARGIDEAAFGGIGTEAAATISGRTDLVENAKRLSEGNTYDPMGFLHTGGQVVGGTMGAGKLAGGLAGKALGTGASYGGAMLRGGLQAAAGAAGTTTSMAAADDKLPGVGDLAMSSALAMPFGAAGGAVGRHLFESTPYGLIKDSGVGKTALIRGLKKTAKGEAISEMAEKATGQTGREVDFLTDRLERPMSKAARELQAGSEARLGEELAEYTAATEEVKRPLTAMVKDAMEIRKSLTRADGRPVPRAEKQIAAIDEWLAGTTETAEIIPSAGGDPLVRKAVPGTIDLTPEEAMRQGINVEHAMQAYMSKVPSATRANPSPAAAPAPGQFIVRVKPAEVNPRELEVMKKALDYELRQGQNVGKEALNPMRQSIRAARDEFPAAGPVPEGLTAEIDTGTGVTRVKDFSAHQRLASEETKGIERMMEASSLPKKVPETLGGNESTAFKAGMSRYKGDRPGGIEADEALKELANLAGRSEQLDAVAGMRAFKEMKGGIPTSFRDILNQGELRLDPLLNMMGPAAAAAAPNAYKRHIQKPLPPQLSEEKLRMLEMLMGP